MLNLSQDLLREVIAESERCYPFEACGFILGKIDGKRTAVRFVPANNIQNELHGRNPERYPRDAKTAYVIDPREMQSVEAEAKAEGLEIISIFHSHPEHGVYFSEEDKGMAAPWGEPLFPKLSYFVVSVYGGKVQNASDFYWESEKKDFAENKIL